MLVLSQRHVCLDQKAVLNLKYICSWPHHDFARFLNTWTGNEDRKGSFPLSPNRESERLRHGNKFRDCAMATNLDIAAQIKF